MYLYCKTKIIQSQGDVSMSKIFNFEQEECQCPYCELVDSYFGAIVEAMSIKELREIINELISEARVMAHSEGFITGSDIGYKEGYKTAVRADVEAKLELLDEIEDECDCDCCNGECEI